ncbi:MAG: hypothetical protein ACKPKO_63460, partial [Candidatus Fonsibacter sp.]
TWGDRCRLWMTEQELSPWQAPKSTFAAVEPAEATPASNLLTQPENVEQALDTANTSNIIFGEEVTVNKVVDGDLANVLFHYC